MKNFILSFITLSLVVIGSFQPINMVKANQNENLTKNLFLNEVESHNIFKEYQDKMLSTEPYILNDLLDENEQKKGLFSAI